MSVKFVEQRGNLTSGGQTRRWHSPGIWHNCNTNLAKSNPDFGRYDFDDFSWLSYITQPTITTEAFLSHGYKAFGSAGATVVEAAASPGGAGLALTETDDNQGASISFITNPYKISRSMGRFAMECRWKVSSITNLDGGVLVGMGEPFTGSATVPITAAGAVADQNLVYHRINEADGDQVDTGYKANGVTAVEVGTDQVSTTNSASSALVADTYIKTGLKYEPFSQRGNYYLTYYINGIELANAKQIPSTDGDDFPNDVNLGFFIALLCGANNDYVLTLDWWAAYQENYIN